MLDCICHHFASTSFMIYDCDHLYPLMLVTFSVVLIMCCSQVSVTQLSVECCLQMFCNFDEWIQTDLLSKSFSHIHPKLIMPNGRQAMILCFTESRIFSFFRSCILVHLHRLLLSCFICYFKQAELQSDSFIHSLGQPV